MVELLQLKGDLSVPFGTNIVGRLTWRNISIPMSNNLVAALLLGKNGSLYYFTFSGNYLWAGSQGVKYYIGSLASLSSPPTGATITTGIQSAAVFKGNWDAFAMIGLLEGPIELASYAGRVVGIRMESLEFLKYYDARWFTGILNVT